MSSKDESDEAIPQASAADEGFTRKERLVQALDEAEAAYAPLQLAVQKIAEHARNERDTIGAVRKVVTDERPEVFSSPDWARTELALRRQIAGVVKFRDYADAAYGALIINANSTAVSTSTAVVSMLMEPAIQTLPTYGQRESLKNYEATLSRFATADRLKTMLTAHGMGHDSGDIRSPLDLVDDAAQALRVPPREDTSPASVLIPMRQAINQSVDRLVKRLPPPQQATGTIGRKLRLLGERCAKQGYPLSYFEELSANATSLVDSLSSGGKDRKLTREELALAFDSGIGLLTAIFDGLDSTKLRSP